MAYAARCRLIVSDAQRRSRSENTRHALMRAAERLFAAQGLQNVTSRAIVEASGQKNESALQYHFKNLSGLLKALHLQRSEQTRNQRAELLEHCLRQSTQDPYSCVGSASPLHNPRRTHIAHRTGKLQLRSCRTGPGIRPQANTGNVDPPPRSSSVPAKSKASTEN